MRKGIPIKYRKSQWVSMVLIALGLSVVMTLMIQLFNSCTKPEQAETTSPKPSAIDSATAQLPKTDTSFLNRQKEKANTVKPVIKEKKTIAPGSSVLPVGLVSISSFDGKLLAEIPAAIVNGSWMALPSRTVIGGNKWIFTSSSGSKTAVRDGLWTWGNDVGLWRLEGEETFPGPSLSAWQPEDPVSLLPFNDKKPRDFILKSEGREGIFAYCPLPRQTPAGVFIQNNKVVGWAFGEMLEGAYMWILPAETDLEPGTNVEAFYNETFAGAREEYFLRALTASSEISPQEQLQIFVEGFWFSPNLPLEDTPQSLQPQTVYPYILQLVDYIMRIESYADIAELSDEAILKVIKSEDLLVYVTRAIQKVYGTETAITFIEGAGEDIKKTIDGKTPNLNSLHLELYKGWIDNLLQNDEITKGWQVFNKGKERFNNALDLHLLGVELALADRDWREAEFLLGQKKYPMEYREKQMLLANRISDIKGKENQIVINFQPGLKTIPAVATVNKRLYQDFIIDTGASFVTIPYSTIEELGLEDELSDEQHAVQTAGGKVYASSITLSSIELGNWEVKKVKALVIDLPNQPNTGLLGLNFLNRFRMDLQVDEGVLILEPR